MITIAKGKEKAGLSIITIFCYLENKTVTEGHKSINQIRYQN